MKKIVMTAALVACAAVVTAQTVTSANIVGYTKVTVEGGSLSLVAVNFETGGAMVSELCNGLPVGGSVFVWDKVAETYAPVSRGARGWVGDRAVALGDSMWIDPGVTPGTYELIFSGEVLTEDAVMTVPMGVIATGYYYPVEADLKTTPIADVLVQGSSFFVWDPITETYSTAARGARGWTGSAISGPKDGFWISNAGVAETVTIPVPFTP